MLKVINASERSIRLAAYSLPSPIIVRALLNAKKRGVDVRVIVDSKRPIKIQYCCSEFDGQCRHSNKKHLCLRHSS